MDFVLVKHPKVWDGRHLSWEQLTLSCLSLTVSQRTSRSRKHRFDSGRVDLNGTKKGWLKMQAIDSENTNGMKTTGSKYLENTKKQKDEDARTKGGGRRSKLLSVQQSLPLHPSVTLTSHTSNPSDE